MVRHEPRRGTVILIISTLKSHTKYFYALLLVIKKTIAKVRNYLHSTTIIFTQYFLIHIQLNIKQLTRI